MNKFVHSKICSQIAETVMSTSHQRCSLSTVSFFEFAFALRGSSPPQQLVLYILFLINHYAFVAQQVERTAVKYEQVRSFENLFANCRNRDVGGSSPPESVLGVVSW